MSVSLHKYTRSRYQNIIKSVQFLRTFPFTGLFQRPFGVSLSLHVTENYLTTVDICVLGQYYSCSRNKMPCSWRHCMTIVTPWRLRQGAAELGWT